MFTIQSNHLRVSIPEPGERPNNNFRFDRSAFVSEVMLDGAVSFCANEPSNLAHPSTGGRGLCCEFKADYSGEVETGEYYPKLGIGLIRKTGAYCFFEHYEDVIPYPVQFAHTEDSAVFTMEMTPCLGIGASLEKKLSVRENTLTLEAALTNTGERAIDTDEYCHNFLSIDGMAISPDYALAFPRLAPQERKPLLDTRGNSCNFIADGQQILFARNETAVSMTHLDLTGMDPAKPFVWTLSHAGAKAKVTGNDEVSVCEILLWSTDHIVSPETIQHIHVEPGDTFRWSRSWTFQRTE